MESAVNEITVLFIWDVPERLRNYLSDGLKDVEGLTLIFPLPADEDEYLKYAPDCEIIVGWRPSRELLDSAAKLRLLINPGAGITHHIEPLREINKTRKVLLANGHGNTYFTAQHVVGILLALMNRITLHHNWMLEGRWRTGDSDARSTPLRDRHVGLLGYGAVNTKVHRFLAGFDLTFSICKRTLDADSSDREMPTEAEIYGIDRLHDFLLEIDILIAAVPLTSRTEGMIGEAELDLLGENGIVVNVGRGQVIDEKALYDALKDGKIAGAAIDVWYDYRPESDEDGRKYPYRYPFHELDNAVLSPHRGASPMNDLRRWDEVIENIKRVRNGSDDLLNIVDLDEEY